MAAAEKISVSGRNSSQQARDAQMRLADDRRSANYTRLLLLALAAMVLATATVPVI
jgi:hypothetical protein